MMPIGMRRCEFPCKIITLWELMERIQGDDFIAVGSMLRLWADLCRQSGTLPFPAEGRHVQIVSGLLSGASLDRNTLASNVEFAERMCERLSLMASRMFAFDLAFQLRHDALPRTLAEVAVELERLLGSIINDAKTQLYLEVPNSLVQYYDQEKLFGEKVHDAFPDARNDIREAGNCLACGNDTAAVFHLMRVAEHGLREIAKKVGIKLTDKGKSMPIEYATWGRVITAINKKIDDEKELSKGPRKNRSLLFYADAAENCKYLKEWRNETSHTRTKYNASEAMGLLIRVRDFMSFLAGRKP